MTNLCVQVRAKYAKARKIKHGGGGSPPTVFQCKNIPARVDISYLHINDIMDASVDLKLSDRIDYCSANGLNLINIFRYLDFVLQLEKCFASTKSVETVGKWWFF